MKEATIDAIKNGFSSIINGIKSIASGQGVSGLVDGVAQQVSSGLAAGVEVVITGLLSLVGLTNVKDDIRKVLSATHKKVAELIKRKMQRVASHSLSFFFGPSAFSKRIFPPRFRDCALLPVGSP